MNNPTLEEMSAMGSRQSPVLNRADDGENAAASRGCALPKSWTVAAARDAYLRENGFTVESYDEAWTHATLLGIDLRVPNTKLHRFVLMRHDLLHVALGFGTDLMGEGEISAFEVGCGLRGVGMYTGLIILGLASLGLAVSPHRALRAWRLGRGKPSLYVSEIPYEELLDMTVGELRTMIHIPQTGVSVARRGLHARAPSPE